jgi:hypothetical protein
MAVTRGNFEKFRVTQNRANRSLLSVT